MQGITPGNWRHEPTDPGHSGSFQEPPDPGCAAYLYSEFEVYDERRCATIMVEIPIATMDEPSYPDGEGEEVVVGEMDEGARFLSRAPEMYRKLTAVLDAMHNSGYNEASFADPPGSPWHGLYPKVKELLDELRWREG